MFYRTFALVICLITLNNTVLATHVTFRHPGKPCGGYKVPEKKPNVIAKSWACKQNAKPNQAQKVQRSDMQRVTELCLAIQVLAAKNQRSHN